MMEDLGWIAGRSLILADSDSMSMKAPNGIVILRSEYNLYDCYMKYGNRIKIFWKFKTVWRVKE